jgi:hypothetical protein
MSHNNKHTSFQYQDRVVKGFIVNVQCLVFVQMMHRSVEVDIEKLSSMIDRLRPWMPTSPIYVLNALGVRFLMGKNVKSSLG